MKVIIDGYETIVNDRFIIVKVSNAPHSFAYAFTCRLDYYVVFDGDNELFAASYEDCLRKLQERTATV